MIFVVETPGTLVQREDINEARRIDRHISVLIDHFEEANCSLITFKEASDRVYHAQKNQDSSRQFERTYDLFQQKIDGDQRGKSTSQLDQANFEAQNQAKHEEWERNGHSRSLLNKSVFITARAFIFAIDNFEKQLLIFAKDEGMPPRLLQIHERLFEFFPNLREVRNSIHHQEDRRRHLKNGGKRIDLKPISTPIIRSDKGMMAISIIHDTKYGCTMSDGHYGEVDVSEESMKKLQELLVDIIQEFEWKGLQVQYPLN